MADKKISALPAASTPLSGTEVLPIVQGGITDQVSVNNLTAGRTVPATRLSMPTGSHTMYVGFDGATDAMQIATQTEINLQTGTGYGMAVNIDSSHNVNVSQGNVKLSTAGKGIDFSANGGDVLSQYDEGTWNVVWTSLTGTPANLVGNYTRIGRLVFFNYATGANSISGSAASTYFSLPFTPAAMCAGVMVSENVNNSGSTLIHTSTRVYPEAFSSSFMVFSGSFYI